MEHMERVGIMFQNLRWRQQDPYQNPERATLQGKRMLRIGNVLHNMQHQQLFRCVNYQFRTWHCTQMPSKIQNQYFYAKTLLCLLIMVTVCYVFIWFNLAGFKIVTSGHECQRISSTEMCKKAFKMLDLKFSGDPWPRVFNYGSSRPKGCFTNSARNILSLNTDASSAAECSLQYPCICYDVDCTTRSTGKWELVWRDWLRSWNVISLPKGGKKSSQIRLCCALPDYILTIQGSQSQKSRVHALSPDPICNPVKPCMANLGNFPHSIMAAVGTTFGM